MDIPGKIANFGLDMAKSSVGFKDSAAAYRALLQEIATGRFHPVYLLMGEEPFFIDGVADKIIGGALTDDERAFNQTIVYGRDSTGGQIDNLCRQAPMIGNRNLVVVKEAQQIKKPELLTHYLSSPSPSTILVICHKQKNVDKRSQFYKLSKQNGVVLESVPARDYEVGPWIADNLRSRGISAEPQAVAILAEHLGTDLQKISGEIDKLMTFLPQGTVTLSADDIERNVGISKEYNNYELTKAISEKNAAKALKIASFFARNPKEHSLVMTVSAMFTHFHRIFVYNYQIWYARNRKTTPPDDEAMSRMMKLPSRFFLQEYKTAAMHYPNRKVFDILGKIREFDLKSKGMDTGGADDGELLRELLLYIFND